MTSNIKCPQCGLINWSDAEACKRCQMPLGGAAHQSAQTTTLNPGYGGFNPRHQQLDDMSYPSYSSYVPAPTFGDRAELASRGSRLVAAVVNNLMLVIPVVLLVVFAVLVADNNPGGEPNGPALGLIALMLIYVLGLGVLQIYYLTTRGQTIGKRMMGIRIIKQETNENGGFLTNVLVREGVIVLLSLIPMVGSFIGLVDVLFIFRADQRCLHDLIAGTIVIKA